MLGDYLPHMPPLVHGLCWAHPATATMIVAANHATIVALGKRRDHIFRLYRYLFTRDQSLLLLPKSPRHSVRIWRAIYMAYVLAVLNTYLNAIVVGLSLM